MATKPPLPTELHTEVGRLCVAWAFLEIATETTIWGILELDQKIGPILTWRLDLRSRWQLILDHSQKKHTAEDQALLRGINKDLVNVTRDRNIVVHGAMHYIEKSDQQCWTVFRGAEAGKSFPASAVAVATVGKNIKRLSNRVTEFNFLHGYRTGSVASDVPEVEWPKPL